MDPHQIVNTIIEQYADPLLAAFELNKDGFRALYCKTHTVVTLPIPIAGSAPVPTGHDTVVIPTPALEAFVKIYRVVENIFLSPWISYTDTTKRQKIAVALKALRVEYLEPTATDGAAILIDSEPAAEPPQLRAIVDAQVLSRTSSLQKELDALKAAIASLKTKERGPPRGASLKRKNKWQSPKTPPLQQKMSQRKIQERIRERLRNPSASRT